jgi:hypothetical protein
MCTDHCIDFWPRPPYSAYIVTASHLFDSLVFSVASLARQQQQQGKSSLKCGVEPAADSTKHCLKSYGTALVKPPIGMVMVFANV